MTHWAKSCPTSTSQIDHIKGITARLNGQKSDDLTSCPTCGKKVNKTKDKVAYMREYMREYRKAKKIKDKIERETWA
jgi:hypothetical protein